MSFFFPPSKSVSPSFAARGARGSSSLAAEDVLTSAVSLPMASASSGRALRIRIRRGLGGRAGRGGAAAATDGDARGRRRGAAASPVIVAFFPPSLSVLLLERVSFLGGKRAAAVIACFCALPSPLTLRAERESERERGRERKSFGRARFRNCVFFSCLEFSFSSLIVTSLDLFFVALLPFERRVFFFRLSLFDTTKPAAAMALASAAGRLLLGRRTAERLAVGLAAAPAAASAGAGTALSSSLSSSSPSAALLAAQHHQQSRRASGHAENTNTFIREVREKRALFASDPLKDRERPEEERWRESSERKQGKEEEHAFQRQASSPVAPFQPLDLDLVEKKKTLARQNRPCSSSSTPTSSSGSC